MPRLEVSDRERGSKRAPIVLNQRDISASDHSQRGEPCNRILGSPFARVSILEYAKFNGFIKQHLTTAKIHQCFRTFLPPTICIEQGADGGQAGLKVERRVRVERGEARLLEVAALKARREADAGTVRPATAP